MPNDHFPADTYLYLKNWGGRFRAKSLDTRLGPAIFLQNFCAHTLLARGRASPKASASGLIPASGCGDIYPADGRVGFDGKINRNIPNVI
jgi:hypothetical protein